MSLCRSLLMSFVLNLICFVIAGCVVSIVPLHSSTTLAINTAASATSTPAPVHEVILPPEPKTKSADCPRYTAPVPALVPAVPDFTKEERRDADKLNERLANYVGVLRRYIVEQARQQEAAYSKYQAQCLNNAL